MTAPEDETILRVWADFCTASGQRPRTIRENLIALRALLRRSGKSILAMKRVDLIADLGRENLSTATKQRYRSLYFGFWTWVQDEEFRLDNPAVRLPIVRVIRQEVNPVTTDDIQRLLNSGIYSRTRSYVVLAAFQGFRSVEVAAVHGKNIDWENRRILSAEAKGGKEVWRPMHPLVWEEAQKYPRDGWWFPSPYLPGQHVTAKSVSRVLSNAMKRAGITGHRPHNFRSWFATEMGEAGAPTDVIAAGLRHSGLQSVSRYRRVSDRLIAHWQEQLPLVEVPSKSMRGAA